MSNIESVNALLTAINFDRFAEIEARHQPDAVFTSFRGPTLHDSVGVADWHRLFLRDYADCNYSELEYVEDGDTVCVRATIEAKGYDWRPFTQRVLEVFRMEDGAIAERRLYGMLRDVELDKAAAAVMTNATGYRGGSAADTRRAVEGFYGALLAGKAEEAMGYLHEKSLMVDSVYGITTGQQNILDLLAQIPTPAFGYWRVNKVFAGPKDAVAELSIDPSRPRAGDWIRMVDGKIAVIEAHWMLREIGLNPYENYAHDRHRRQVILPI
jgi:ketosteroid isomerase-like protein